VQNPCNFIDLRGCFAFIRGFRKHYDERGMNAGQHHRPERPRLVTVMTRRYVLLMGR
jgi:hypothetical protein